MEILEMAIWAGLAVIVLVVPPLLITLAFRQLRKSGDKRWWPAVLAAAMLVEWLFTIASLLPRLFTSTRAADVFLVVALLLLIGAALVRIGRWKLCAAALLLFSSLLWTEQRLALRDHGSTLSVYISMFADAVGVPTGDASYEVLRKMSRYGERGHDDAAIRAGKAWLKAHPGDVFLQDRVCLAIAWAYLDKAQHDRSHLDDYVHEALLYRDKALPPSADDPWRHDRADVLSDLARVSKLAGDISPQRKCVQYQNAVNLLEKSVESVEYQQQVVTQKIRRDEGDPSEADFKKWIDGTKTWITRIHTEQQEAGCLGI